MRRAAPKGGAKGKSPGGRAGRLEDLRRSVDGLDRRIVDLLIRRLGIGRRILDAKRVEGGRAYDPTRERHVLARLQSLAGGKIPKGSLQAIYREIISATRTLQAQSPIAYLGSEGSLAHYAANLRFGSSAPVVAVRRPVDLFEWVESGRGRYGLFTMEGWSEQASLDSLDQFLGTRLKILAEFYVEDAYGLFTKPGARSIRRVYAHPTALAACAGWVEAQAERLEVVATATSLEAGRLASRGRTAGALGNPLLESLCGLERRAELLNDDGQRHRRFLILSEDQLPRTGNDKTSLLTVIPNRPGGLHLLTTILARRKINLCWIQARVTRIGTWDHIFWLEVEGHRDEKRVKDCLQELRGSLEYLKVIGSYPLERPPIG